MESETINQENFATAPWEDDLFRYCNFEDFSMDGGHVTSDFIGCSFRNLDWYWGLFNCVNFIDCKFTDCVFRGSSFLSCRFIECALTSCRFVKDSLDDDCRFENSIAYGCAIAGCEGLLVESVGDPRHTSAVFPTPDSSA